MREVTQAEICKVDSLLSGVSKNVVRNRFILAWPFTKRTVREQQKGAKLK